MTQVRLQSVPPLGARTCPSPRTTRTMPPPSPSAGATSAHGRCARRTSGTSRCEAGQGARVLPRVPGPVRATPHRGVRETRRRGSSGPTCWRACRSGPRWRARTRPSAQTTSGSGEGASAGPRARETCVTAEPAGPLAAPGPRLSRVSQTERESGARPFTPSPRARNHAQLARVSPRHRPRYPRRCTDVGSRRSRFAPGPAGRVAAGRSGCAGRMRPRAPPLGSVSVRDALAQPARTYRVAPAVGAALVGTA